jgi:nucleoside-diphosphate-sugar epimerase
MTPKPRVLVTGAPGWLGSSLVEALTGGFRSGPVDHRPESVRIVSLPGSDARALTATGKVEVASADLRDRRLPDGLFDGIDTVYHCAGVIHAKRIKDLYTINVDATRNLLEAAIAAKVRRFVFVSSNSPAGLNASPTQLMLEEDPPRPYLNYGLSKLQSEWLVNDAHRAGKIEGVILRPCWFYGPNQPLRQTTFFKMIKKGHPPIVGKGDNLRSMSYVDNTVQGLILARDVQKAAGQTYWITDRRPYSFIEILETVGKLLGVSIRPRYLPGITGDVARLADSLLQMTGLYNQEIHVLGELGESIAVSIEKAKRELGYDPQIDLEEGMRRSIEWCRSMGVEI